MIVPQYWAEGRVQHKRPDKQITVRRFGWSDSSEAEAQSMADGRAQEALDRILAGEKLEKREPKVAYNGAEGVPIREEIISRHGDAVVTRNVYGALCLNTPNVLFVDIDIDFGPRYDLGCLWPFLISVAAIISAFVLHSIIPVVVWIAVWTVLGKWVLPAMNAIHEKRSETPQVQALQKIEAFSDTHPDLHLRVYETPAGFRVLVMNDVFDPTADETGAIFKRLSTDPMYVLMCQRQRCFRARVSPKPWRIGISKHLRPRPGVWPIKPERLPIRQKWVAAYEARSEAFASCRFVKTLGSTAVHPDAESVRAVHDALAKVDSGMPIA